MRIFVLGNINSGKSTLIDQLKVYFPNKKILKLDDYRIKYGDGTIKTEKKIQKMFATDILKDKNSLIEYTGFGNIYDLIKDKIDCNNLVIKVDTLKEKCIFRIKEKASVYKRIPYPREYKKILINEVITDIDTKISNNLIEILYKDISLNVITYQKEIDLRSIILRYELLNPYIIQIQEKVQIENIVLFGSLPVLDVNKYSDLDLYIISRRFDEIYEYYESMKLDKFGKFKNKIYFTVDSILIEIYIVDIIDDIINSYLVYNGSYSKETIFKSAKRFILLCGKDITSKLEKKENLYIDVNNLVEEAKYTLAKLDNLVLSNDIYKFNFHYFILVHLYIRIKAYYSYGNKNNYLPAYAYRLIDDDETDLLNIGLFNNNLGNNRNKITKLFKSLFTDFNL